jgi:hypothetical protein
MNLRFAINTEKGGFIDISMITNIDLKSHAVYRGSVIGKKICRDTIMAGIQL